MEPKTITTLADHQSIYMSHAQIILAEEDDDEGVAYAEPFTRKRPTPADSAFVAENVAALTTLEVAIYILHW